MDKHFYSISLWSIISLVFRDCSRMTPTNTRKSTLLFRKCKIFCLSQTSVRHSWAVQTPCIMYCWWLILCTIYFNNDVAFEPRAPSGYLHKYDISIYQQAKNFPIGGIDRILLQFGSICFHRVRFFRLVNF